MGSCRQRAADGRLQWFALDAAGCPVNGIWNLAVQTSSNVTSVRAQSRAEACKAGRAVERRRRQQGSVTPSSAQQGRGIGPAAVPSRIGVSAAAVEQLTQLATREARRHLAGNTRPTRTSLKASLPAPIHALLKHNQHTDHIQRTLQPSAYALKRFLPPTLCGPPASRQPSCCWRWRSASESVAAGERLGCSGQSRPAADRRDRRLPLAVCQASCAHHLPARCHRGPCATI